MENRKYKCEKKENKRKVGVLIKERTTQKCHGHRNVMKVMENGINRNVAVAIKVENHMNVIDVLEK